MKMHVDKMGEINKWFAEHSRKDIACKAVFDVSLEPDATDEPFSDVNVIVDGSYLCDLSSLNDLIEHLELLKQYVVEWTGIYPWED